MDGSSPRVTALSGRRAPFGSSFDPDLDAGLELSQVGYLEEEYLLAGLAGTWDTGAPGQPRRRDFGIEYRTRLLVRRPADTAGESGITHVEPLHPHVDAGLTWDALAPHLIRRGDAWVGVTLYPDVARMMTERIDPERYGPLSVPGAGTEWDIFSDALTAVRHNEVGGLHTSRIVMSGWSATGSFCRVFAREGFVTARGGLADGVAIFISSGGAGTAGYPVLSPTSVAVDEDDPRRTVRDVGVPTFEILSETESETHRGQLRDDSDDPADTYRLYQIAGSAHIENWPAAPSTHALRMASTGIPLSPIAVREPRSDARSDLVSRALLDRLIESIEGTAAPRAPRFAYAPGPVPLDRILRRDQDGNVQGGIRTPWVQAALARYSPHGTAADLAEPGPDWTPLSDRDLAARLVGTMTALPASEVLSRCSNAEDYERAFAESTRALVKDGFLVAEDAPDLDASASGRWMSAVGSEDAQAPTLD